MMIVYDIEIIKGILGKNSEPHEDIEYCAGWHDHENMGISVIGAYDYAMSRYRVFCEDNFDQFQELVDQTDCVAGFNNIAFDNAVCRAHNINVPDDKSYDLLVEVWKGHGLADKFKYPSHIGFSLDAIASCNIDHQKTGHGELAPVQWQRGKIGSVIDYCLADVWLTKQLIDCVMSTGSLLSPRNGKPVKIMKPQINEDNTNE